MKASFRDVKADILARITQGVWGPGALLPNEVELAERFGCARATVNRAMQELADDGIIERRRKAGTRVRAAPIRQARFEIPTTRSEVEAGGSSYRYALVERSVTAAADWLRPRLQLGEGAQVLHLTCMHFADGAPYQHEDRWISLRVLPQAKDADFAAAAPTEWLISTIPYSNAEIGFSAVAAEADVASNLGCAAGEPLFRIERSTWWEGDAVTFVRLSFRPGHRMTTRY